MAVEGGFCLVDIFVGLGVGLFLSFRFVTRPTAEVPLLNQTISHRPGSATDEPAQYLWNRRWMLRQGVAVFGDFVLSDLASGV